MRTAPVLLPSMHNRKSSRVNLELAATPGWLKHPISSVRESPSASSPPIITQAVASNAQYVTGIKYNNPGTTSGVGVVVTLGNTGNAQIDGHYLGMFGTGKADGTVVWTCATAQTANDSASGAAVQSMYPYLPAACQN